jgi:hypothetical protein
MVDKCREESLIAQIIAIRQARSSVMRRADLPSGERVDRFVILSDELFRREAELFGRQPFVLRS